MNTEVQLLAYADRLGGDIPRLHAALDRLRPAFGGVHILPFYVPFDGADAGFDPVDHAHVDPRLGDWRDVQRLREDGYAVMADIIVNHMSADSVEFQDWLARGEESPYDGLFLTFDTVFDGAATEAGITAFYRPREGLPFTPYVRADGTRRLVWTTFMPSQVDIDVTSVAGRDYLDRILRTLADGGVGIVRVDAVGYAIKTVGSDSFMTEETLGFVDELAQMAKAHGLDVLVEVHANYRQQLRIAERVDYVYDFAIPALYLHSLVSGRVNELAHWFGIRPTNAITVLDTHDGIGIIDAGPIGEQPGLISQEDMAAIFMAANEATGGVSGRVSVTPQWFDLPHQINSTFYGVLGRDPVRYLLARIVQFFAPGIPQVYYVGLLAGGNDLARYEATGQGREVNRHVYDAAEFESALETEVVRGLLGLAVLRGQHPAFGGEFSLRQQDSHTMTMRWQAGQAVAEARVDVANPAIDVRVTGGGPVDAAELHLESVAALARLWDEVP